MLSTNVTHLYTHAHITCTYLITMNTRTAIIHPDKIVKYVYRIPRTISMPDVTSSIGHFGKKYYLRILTCITILN